MEIKYKTGCLLEAAKTGEVQAIGHGCNCFNTMKSGIAPQIAREYPEASDVDHATQKGDKNKLGSVTYVTREKHPHMVFNLYTQFHYGRDGRQYLDYEALESALYLVNENIKNHNEDNPLQAVSHIGLPQIGCGLAGGKWGKVSKIIEKVLADVKPVVYVLKK